MQRAWGMMKAAVSRVYTLLLTPTTTCFRMYEVWWYSLTGSYLDEFLLCSNRDDHDSFGLSRQRWCQQPMGRKWGHLRGTPFYAIFTSQVLSVLRGLEPPRTWADRDCVPGICIPCPIRRPLDYHVAFISVIMHWVLSSTKSIVRRICSILCICDLKV